MSHHRHADEARATPANTPPELRARVEALRARATRRKLLLLECAIVRHAPFADCGRPLWELMAEQPWFKTTLPPAEWCRHHAATGKWLGNTNAEGRPCVFTPATGHDAIEWLEQHADGVGNDEWFLAKEYFHQADYAAEGHRFVTPDDRRDELETLYGTADWPSMMTVEGRSLHNVLDYYLAHYAGEFYCWAAWRPLHPGHRPAALALIDDIFGPEFPRFDPAWRTSDATGLAAAMYEARDFGAAPVLADALEEAGCDNLDLLAHCRAGGRHVRGCWAVDLVLGKFH